MSTTHAILAIRDSAMGRFMPPMTMPSVAYAIRSFADEVNRESKENQMYQHPEDFELFHIADWSEDHAQYTLPQDGMRPVARAKDHHKGE